MLYKYIPIDQRKETNPFILHIKSIEVPAFLTPDQNINAINLCLSAIVGWENINDQQGNSHKIQLTGNGTIELRSLMQIGVNNILEVANVVYEFSTFDFEDIQKKYDLEVLDSTTVIREKMNRLLTTTELKVYKELWKIQDIEKSDNDFVSKENLEKLRQLTSEERQKSYEEREKIRVAKQNTKSDLKRLEKTFNAFVDVDNILAKHIDVLSRKQRQLITKNDYGQENRSKWETELKKFKQTVIGTQPNKLVNDYVDERIEYMIFQYNNSVENSSIDFNDHMNPYEYEHYCASLLSKAGWETNVTQSSGDQGVDVIAVKEGIKIAVQCKLYGLPVGNKAVQEVFAAKQHIGANYAAVVTNSSFTQSAKELANTTGVMLLHHSELEELE